MAAVIEIENLRKTYRPSFKKPVEALRGISLSLGEGQAFGFVGPNGAGKSTTIKILTGAIRKYEGKALINGKPVEDYRARHQVGYVPENPYLYDYLTPRELLLMGLQLHGVDRSARAARADLWLERLGIAHAGNRRIRTLSKGMTQRTALAHALAVQPHLLILDEPLSGLDPVGRRQVIDLLLEYRQQGGSLFFSSHVLYDVERLADQVVFINQGLIHSIAPPESIASGSGYSIRSSGGTMVPGQGVELGSRFTYQVSSEGLWAALRELESAGQTVLEVRPQMSVETAYLEMVGRG